MGDKRASPLSDLHLDSDNKRLCAELGRVEALARVGSTTTFNIASRTVTEPNEHPQNDLPTVQIDSSKEQSNVDVQPMQWSHDAPPGLDGQLPFGRSLSSVSKQTSVSGSEICCFGTVSHPLS